MNCRCYRGVPIFLVFLLRVGSTNSITNKIAIFCMNHEEKYYSHKFSTPRICHFYGTSEAKGHVGITWSVICRSIFHTLLSLAPHAFCRILVYQSTKIGTPENKAIHSACFHLQHVLCQVLYVIIIRYLFIAKSKSSSPPESPSPSEGAEMGMGWAPRLERAYDRQKQADIPGGRLPHFSLTLPKVVELDEGDKLHLDCTIEGWPRPMCKL